MLNLFVKSESEWISLDLLDDSPIKVSKSIQTLENPQTTTSSYSRTFKVPNTFTNNKFFQAVFNVNSVTFNATKKAEAYITVEGRLFVSGYIILNSVSIQSDVNKIEYELIFFGETSSFSSVVSPKKLSQLDLSELVHDFSYNNIRSSWSLSLFGGNVLYPLVEYGYSYNETTKQPNENTLSVFNGTTSLKGFTNSANPLSKTQFKPFLKAKYVWDKIFSEAGFTYTSSFLSSSPIFNNLYMVSTSDVSSQSTIDFKVDLATSLDMNGIILGASDTKMLFPTESWDYGNNWDISTSKFTANFPGTYVYNFRFSFAFLNFTAPAKAGSNERTFNINAKITGPTGSVSFQNKTAYVDAGTNAAVTIPITRNVFSNSPYSPSPDDKFIWNLSLDNGATVEFFTNPGTEINPGSKLIPGFLAATGPNLVNPTILLPSQYNQIDFVKGINDRFKLMWQPDLNNPNNFIIEPWVDWIKGGNKKDWSSKLDQNQAITITPLFQGQERKLIFKDAEEFDILNDNYQKTNKQTFGQLNQDSGIEIITGEREITSIFSPFQLSPIGNSNTFLIPHLAKDSETQREPIQIKPRLCFYNGTGPAPHTWYFRNDSNVSVAQTSYPIVSNFSTYPFNIDSLDLSWANVQQYWGVTGAAIQYGTGQTQKTSFTTYWKSWYDLTYSPYSRVMEATFILNLDDVYSLDFADKIYVKDSWWLPIEIKDFDLGLSKQAVKCKLVKLGEDVGVNI